MHDESARQSEVAANAAAQLESAKRLTVEQLDAQQKQLLQLQEQHDCLAAAVRNKQTVLDAMPAHQVCKGIHASLQRHPTDPMPWDGGHFCRCVLEF